MTARQLARAEKVRANIEDLARGIIFHPTGWGWVVWYNRSEPREIPHPDVHVFIPWSDLPTLPQQMRRPGAITEAMYYLFTRGGQ